MRVLKLSLQNIGRNFWLSLTGIFMIALMFISLTIFGGINFLTGTIVQSWEEKMDLTIYLEAKAPESKVNLLRSELENMPEVKELSYIDPQQALERFKTKHAQDELIIQSLEEIKENPLGGAITVKLINPSDYQNVLETINSREEYQEVIQNKDFVDFEQLIDLFNQFSQKIRWLTLGISGVFVLIAILVIFNTIKLGIYARRKELKIMRLVGATSAFIRGPFFLESCLLTFFGWLLNVLIIIPLLLVSQPYLETFFGVETEIIPLLKGNGAFFLISLLIFGLIIALLSSGAATKKYLKT